MAMAADEIHLSDRAGNAAETRADSLSGTSADGNTLRSARAAEGDETPQGAGVDFGATLPGQATPPRQGTPPRRASAIGRARLERSGSPVLDQARDALMRTSLFDSAIVFWRGTSGHEYVHTIYGLTGCPAVPPASVMLVRASDSGQRRVLRVMAVEHAEHSLNLAEIRQAGAELGANEVHLHFATGNRFARQTAAFDLRTLHGGMAVVGD